jgi:hypothetical protein
MHIDKDSEDRRTMAPWLFLFLSPHLHWRTGFANREVGVTQRLSSLYSTWKAELLKKSIRQSEKVRYEVCSEKLPERVPVTDPMHAKVNLQPECQIRAARRAVKTNPYSAAASSAGSLNIPHFYLSSISIIHRKD